MFTFTPKKRRKAKLEELQVDEISLVDRPANRGARIVLLKRDETAPSRQPKDTEKMFFKTAEDVGEFLRGGVAVISKSESTTLESVVAWMSEHAAANQANKVQLAKSLELQCPSVSDVDEAIGELARSIQKASEPHYKAYARCLESQAGAELYALRDCLERCGSDGSEYSNLWDRERQATRR